MGERKPGIDRYALNLVRAKARALVGQYGFTKDDRHDLEQELFLDIVQRLGRYDESRATLSMFVASVVNNRIANLIRDRRAGKRLAGGPPEELDAPIAQEFDGNDIELIPKQETFDHDRDLFQRGNACRTAGERRDLALDVAAVVAGLPEDLKDLCARLRSQSVSEVAAETQVPRSTLYDAIRRLRDAFRQVGLDGYLADRSDTFDAARVRTGVKGDDDSGGTAGR